MTGFVRYHRDVGARGLSHHVEAGTNATTAVMSFIGDRLRRLGLRLRSLTQSGLSPGAFKTLLLIAIYSAFSDLPFKRFSIFTAGLAIKTEPV